MDFITVAQAAKELGVTTAAIYNRGPKGDLPGLHRVGTSSWAVDKKMLPAIAKILVPTGTQKELIDEINKRTIRLETKIHKLLEALELAMTSNVDFSKLQTVFRVVRNGTERDH